MSRRFLFLLAFLCASIACSEKKEAPAPQPQRNAGPPAPVHFEKDNLASLVRGAVVTSRTGEHNLQTSALLAFDTSIETGWLTPVEDVQQSVTLRLPQPVQLAALTLSNTDGRGVKRLSIETSEDGSSFTPLTTIESKKPITGEKFPLPPKAASVLRFTIESISELEDAAHVASIEIQGTPSAKVSPVPLSGTWKVNDFVLTSAQKGDSIAGATSQKLPFELIGHRKGASVPFAWRRGAEIGFGLLAVDATGDHLNALLWHEKPISLFLAPAWFGSRSSEEPVAVRVDERRVVEHFMFTIGRYPEYRFEFDAEGGLIAGAEHLRLLFAVAAARPQYRFHIVAFASSDADEKKNRSVSEARARSLEQAAVSLGLSSANVDFVASGSHYDHDAPQNETHRALYDRVDLELVDGSGRSVPVISLR